MAKKKDKTEKVEKTLTTSYTIKPLTQSDKTKVIKRALIYLAVSIILTIAIFYLSFSLIGAFPEYVPITTADKLSEIMITANGILLGFVGIIFAQLLSSVMTQQTVLHQSMLEKPEKAANIKKAMDFLDYRRSSLSFIAVSTFAFLLMSIFLSMVVIARNSQYQPTDTYSTFGILYGPMLFTIIAIVFLILAFTALPMGPQLEKEKAKA